MGNKKWIVDSDGVCVYVGNPSFRPDLTAPDYTHIGIPRPTIDHMWDDTTSSWVLSSVLSTYRKRENIRVECDRRLNSMFCHVCYQHDCQLLIDLGETGSLPYTEAQLVEILQYRNALRTFPDDPTTNLDNPVYPVKPSFL